MSVHRAMPRRNVRLASLRDQLTDSLWFVPGLWVAGAAVTAGGLIALDSTLTRHLPHFTGDASSATSFVGTAATAIISMTTLVLSVTVLALQLSSQQFSPRVMRTFFRDETTKQAIGMLLGAFIYEMVVLQSIRTEDGTRAEFVPTVAVFGAFVIVLAVLAVFLYFIDHVSHSIRVVYIIESVAEDTHTTIRRVIAPGSEPDINSFHLGSADDVIVHSGRAGYLTDIDRTGLVELAETHDCVLALRTRIGGFVPTGSPLVEVWHEPTGGRPPTTDSIHEHLAFGVERTMYQDVAFGFRQLVDIAERALSPAVNDPTTAVQALDRIHDLLRTLATSDLPTGYHLDESEALRLVVPVHAWSDYVSLALSEIAQYGAESLQIQRRLRCLLDDLEHCVGGGTSRAAPLAEERRRLDAAVDASPDAVTALRMRSSDDHGLG